MEFDIPILYINLDKRTDKKEHIEKLLDGYNYERVSAVHDDNGYIGCAKSHIKCMEIIIQKGYDRCIILEDDFTWLDDNNFNNLDIPDLDFDIFLFCNYFIIHDKIDDKYRRIKNAQWTSGYMVNKTIVEDLRYNLIEGMTKLSECYKIPKDELYEIKTVGRKKKSKTVKVLKTDFKDYYLDIYWNKLFDKYMAVGLYKKVASQLNGYSDIQNKVINRYKTNN